MDEPTENPEEEAGQPVAPEPPPTSTPGKIEKLLKMAGLELADIAAALEPLILQSTAKLLNQMKIPDAIAQAVESKTTAIGQEVKAALSRIEAAAQQTAPVSQQPQAAQVVQVGMGEALISALAQKIIGGGGGGGGMGGLKEMFEGMAGFMKMTAALYQEPRLAAQQEIINVMKAGYSIGLNTEQIITGADKSVSKGLESLVKPQS